MKEFLSTQIVIERIGHTEGPVGPDVWQEKRRKDFCEDVTTDPCDSRPRRCLKTKLNRTLKGSHQDNLWREFSVSHTPANSRAHILPLPALANPDCTSSHTHRPPAALTCSASRVPVRSKHFDTPHVLCITCAYHTALLTHPQMPLTCCAYRAYVRPRQ